jgi:hypothetical protein
MHSAKGFLGGGMNALALRARIRMRMAVFIGGVFWL